MVESGKPEIVVRDAFAPNLATAGAAVERPKETIVSNSGEYSLQGFKNFYRVYDAASGDLVLERAGRNPNFSPSGRFLGAFADGPGFEIVDLYAGVVIFTSGALNRARSYEGTAHVAAWSHGDALAAMSFWGYGGIYLQQTLVDGSGAGDGSASCHACQGIGVLINVNYDKGFVTWSGQSKGWASLYDHHVAVNANASRPLAKVRLYFDGQLWKELPASGLEARIDDVVEFPAQARWLSVVAVDMNGNESEPVAREVPRDARPSTRKLYAIAVATDHYDRLSQDLQLQYATYDAKNFLSAVRSQKSGYYGKIEVTPFIDAANMSDLPNVLKTVAQTATQDDTIMLYVSGHSFRDSKNKLYLLTKESDPQNLFETALPWDELASAFDGARARASSSLSTPATQARSKAAAATTKSRPPCSRIK